MTALVLGFDQIDRHALGEVGGKGANLGEMARAGFPVPEGFCVTTAGYRAFVAPVEDAVMTHLDGLDPADLGALRRAGQAVRDLMARCALPEVLAEAITAAWHKRPVRQAYAVRSSATAEDLPNASFAGQQDTYLNVIGLAALLAQVKNCFVSLFTDRAILYRIQNGFSHRQVALSVVVQRMVQPELSGILFTADPITENRTVCSIDASFGLGEALVSGLVSADLYKVDKAHHLIVTREIATKTRAILSVAGGGTQTVDLPPEQQTRAALTDRQVLDLAELGARIEAHYGQPQDVEWAIEGGRIFVTQSRPITSLYPLPRVAPGDGSQHIFLSLSHLQVMTDAMPPLAISIWKYFPPIGLNAAGEFRYLQDVGGRLYADLSPILRHPLGRRVVTRFLGLADQLSQAAVRELAGRPAFRAQGPRFNPLTLVRQLRRQAIRVPGFLLLWAPPADTAFEVTRQMDAYVRQVRRDLHDPARDHAQRLEAALDALRGVLPVAGAWVPQMIAGMVAQRQLHRLAGPENAALVTDIERGVEGNVVTEMNLALGDLADLARQSPQVLDALADTARPVAQRLAGVRALPGGAGFLAALDEFLDTYGARGPSEIDISRPRWHEDPASLVQMITGMTAQTAPGAHRRHYAALTAAADLAARALPARIGWHKRGLARRFIRVSRAFMPLREHHKFLMIQVLAEVKTLLLDIAQDFAHRKIVAQAGDLWFLTVPELRDALSGRVTDLRDLADERRAAHAVHARKAPPRVMTGAGEIPRPSLSSIGAPNGALIGSPVSAGVYSGVARVVRDPGVETLAPGEILVAPFTDPGWTPLFVNAGALVTEVGGLMTHGSVVAREYGIPAVVGVPEATMRIKTGDRLRVHGDAGYIEFLTEDEA